MRILLFGKNGQLGWELQRSLATLGEITALDYPEVNFSTPGGLMEAIEQTHPEVVVNAAAYTAVDRAESEPQIAEAVNAEAPGALAEAARAQGAVFIHYSTDYVFDGVKGSAYTENDAPHPINAYGRSKLNGELAVLKAGGASLILRTSWVYSTRAGGFVTKVLQWARQQPRLRIVSDQVGSPTWARMLAEATAQVLAMSGKDPYSFISARAGIYHLAGSGSASRLEWAQEILKNDPRKDEQLVEAILPAQTDEFPTPACRPRFSSLDCSRFEQVFGLRLPHWQHALHMAMDREAG
ncbi:MAG: dTDP-4-dehydrorhamnose reductase [Chloroflexi bacterium]|nr:dTDP-4-dehydrorhamnose reductase [Chloroflexota bacterium]